MSGWMNSGRWLVLIGKEPFAGSASQAMPSSAASFVDVPSTQGVWLPPRPFLFAVGITRRTRTRTSASLNDVPWWNSSSVAFTIVAVAGPEARSKAM